MDPLTTSLGLVSKGEVQINVTPAPGKNDIIDAENSLNVFNSFNDNTTTEFTDTDIINIIRINSTDYTYEINSIARGLVQISLTFQQTKNIQNISLNASHIGNVYALSGGTEHFYVGTITLSPNDNKSINYSVSKDDDGISNTSNNGGVAKIGDVPKLDFFISNSFTNINNVLTSSSPMIKIEWDNGSKINSVIPFNN